MITFVMILVVMIMTRVKGRVGVKRKPGALVMIILIGSTLTQSQLSHGKRNRFAVENKKTIN